mmetsp:Transcript_53569/g.104761  ORF Transcript_53569/g.104761 Transcript_53569/m.104761 type:complete len:132 (-) Transcript_53569:699-1094(-)
MHTEGSFLCSLLFTVQPPNEKGRSDEQQDTHPPLSSHVSDDTTTNQIRPVNLSHVTITSKLQTNNSDCTNHPNQQADRQREAEGSTLRGQAIRGRVQDPQNSDGRPDKVCVSLQPSPHPSATPPPSRLDGV